MQIPTSICLALLMVLGASVQASAEMSVDRYTFTRPAAPESTVDPKTGRLSVDIDRWSTGTEREQVIAAIKENGPEKLLDGLREVGRIGTIYWPGGLEYPVRYAWRETRGDGGADLVLVIDRPLWIWWDSSAPSTPYQYTVLQMRLGKDGTGEGRVSMGVPVAGDTALGVVLSDYAKAPALLADVRREQGGTD